MVDEIVQRPTGEVEPPKQGFLIRPGRILPVQLDAELARGLPGLLRVTASASFKISKWAVGSTLNTGVQIVKRTLNGEAPAEVLDDLTADVRGFVRRILLGDEEVAAKPTVGQVVAKAQQNGYSADSLRRRGEILMRMSADVRVVEEGHPAYARILSELTPDEARILRFLYAEGPQPAIDVRTNRPLGIGSELISGGLNMIAEYAGCRHIDRIHPYLTNLYRLGLIEFSKDEVANPNRYQLVEAQPKVEDVLHRAGRSPRIVRRSIHLNNFGEGFCATCLPVKPRTVTGEAVDADSRSAGTLGDDTTGGGADNGQAGPAAQN